MKSEMFRLRKMSVPRSIISAAILLVSLFVLARLSAVLGVITVAGILGAFFICYRMIYAVLLTRLEIDRVQLDSPQPKGQNDIPPNWGQGPDNFPGGSRVPKVPKTPLLSGSAAKHLPSPHVPHLNYHAFAEIEAEMRRSADVSRHWRQNLGQPARPQNLQ